MQGCIYQFLLFTQCVVTVHPTIGDESLNSHLNLKEPCPQGSPFCSHSVAFNFYVHVLIPTYRNTTAGNIKGSIQSLNVSGNLCTMLLSHNFQHNPFVLEHGSKQAAACLKRFLNHRRFMKQILIACDSTGDL